MAATLDLGVLGFSLTLDKNDWNKSWSDASGDMEKQSSKIGSLTDKIGSTIKVGIAAAATAAGAALVSMVKSGVENARDLDKQMSLFASHTGASADEVEKVRNTVKELYKVNEDSYEDIAATAEALHNAMGMNADDIEKYAQSYMNYAKVTGQANVDAVGAIDDLGDAWGLSADESVSAMDKILVMNQKYGASVTDTQAALTKMAPAAKAAGYSMDEAASYLAMFAAAGIDSGTAATAFSKALQAVESPEELQKLITDISNTTDPFERARKASELFGAKAGPQMAQALGDGTVSLEDFVREMEAANGAVSAASDAYDDNFDTRMALLGKRFGGMATEIGEKLLPIAEKLLGWVEDHMPEIEATISGVFDAISNAITWFSENIMPALSSAFEGIFAVIQTIWPAIEGIVKTAIDVITGVIGTVAALLKGDWSGAWESFKGVISTVTGGIKNVVSGAWNGIKSTIGGAMDNIKSNLSAGWDNIKSGVSSAWENVKQNTSTAWNNVKSTISTVWNGIDSATGGSLSKMQSQISTAWEGVRNGTVSKWDAIKTTVSSVTEGIREGAANAFETLKTKVATIWEGIKEAINKPIQAAKDFVGGVIDTIKGWFGGLSFKLPEFQWPKIKLPHFSLQGEFSLSPLSVPKLAIDWYAKGAIFAKPTIFPTEQGLKGVGDVPGGEVVAPLSTLRDYIQDALLAVLPTAGMLTLIIEVDGMAIAKTQVNYMDMLLSGEVNRTARGIIK